MTEWEKVDAVPTTKTHGGGNPKLRLAPGEVIRRVVAPQRSAGTYSSRFRKYGQHDYHSIRRTVDGVAYIYIWRDPA